MLESLSGVPRMSDEYVKSVFNRLIIELDEALIKAKASLDLDEDDEPCSCRTCDMIRMGYEENE